MARCPSCDYPLPDDRDRVGARCPNCRDPLYEPPGRVGRPAREEEGQCPVHPGVETVGTCRRCGNYICEVCRTRWREYILCAACVERALNSKEATPELEKAHRRQAFWSLGLGIGVWAFSIMAFVIMSLAVAAMQIGGGEQAIVGLVMILVLLPAPLMAVFAIGSGAAALRPRGSHMIPATTGLLLSSLFLGGWVGLFTFSIWLAVQ